MNQWCRRTAQPGPRPPLKGWSGWSQCVARGLSKVLLPFGFWALSVASRVFFFHEKFSAVRLFYRHPLNQNEYTDCTVCQEEAVLHFMLPALSIFAHCGEYSAAVGERDWVPWWLAVHPVQSPSATSQQDLGNHRGGHRTPPPPPRQFSASVFPISLTFFPGSAQFVFLFSMAIDD